MPERPITGDPIAALDLVTDYAEIGCHRQAIELGSAIRNTYRQKTYSVSAEIFSVFLPEEVLSEYVLESYERAFLSFVLASSYLKLGDKDAASVELRRANSEGKALLYNYGEDPVNILMSAALWDNLQQPDSARPFWQKLSGILREDNPVRELANERIRAIDRGGTTVQTHWRIVGLGRFPSLDWQLTSDTKRDSYFTMKPLGDLPKDCRSPTGAVLGTGSWLEKLAHRYSSDYHPLLHLKTWVRMPIGAVYGLGIFSAGLGVVFAGCAVDGSMKGNADLCKASIDAGTKLISHAGEAASFPLRPDLRHWRRLPSAVMITTASDLTAEACWLEQPQAISLLSHTFAN